MSSKVLVNGRAKRSIDVGDRGLHYGDGLFETMAVAEGRVRRLDSHLDRLQLGCTRLGIDCPERTLLVDELRQFAEGEARAVVKLIVTRGSGARGYRSDEMAAPSRITSLHPWPPHPPEWWEQGIAVRYCRTPLGNNPSLAGIKHLNRLEQVLARREWSDPGIAEGLMLDASGAVVCGTMSNVFVVHEGTLLTPRVDRCGVAGTLRRAVLLAAGAWGMQVRETVLTRAELARAEEIFLTNAIVGIWPVRSIEEQSCVIGPVTRRLQTELPFLTNER